MRRSEAIRSNPNVDHYPNHDYNPSPNPNLNQFRKYPLRGLFSLASASASTSTSATRPDGGDDLATISGDDLAHLKLTHLKTSWQDEMEDLSSGRSELAHLKSSWQDEMEDLGILPRRSPSPRSAARRLEHPCRQRRELGALASSSAVRSDCSSQLEEEQEEGVVLARLEGPASPALPASPASPAISPTVTPTASLAASPATAPTASPAPSPIAAPADAPAMPATPAAVPATLEAVTPGAAVGAAAEAARAAANLRRLVEAARDEARVWRTLPSHLRIRYSLVTA